MKPGKSGMLKTSCFFSRGRNKIAEIGYVGMFVHWSIIEKVNLR